MGGKRTSAPNVRYGWKADIERLALHAMSDDTITLLRPVGPVELRLIEEAGMAAFPPRLPEQPIFYPATSEEYAVKIARGWNVPQSRLSWLSWSCGSGC
jgi:hypothetical protein